MKRKTAVWLLAGVLALSAAGSGGRESDTAESSAAVSGGVIKDGVTEGSVTEDGVIKNSIRENRDTADTDKEGSGKAAENPRRDTAGDESPADNKGQAPTEAAVENDAEDAEVTLVMVGDILLHSPVAESALREDGSYSFDAVFANVKEEIEAADLALVNQEVIIGGSELGVTGYPSFNAPYELGDALVQTGFDVVLHATNHALDKGKRGVDNCLRFWEENYPEIAVLGINGSAEAQDEIYVYEKDGIRVAVLNYTYGCNGIPLPEDMPYAVNLLEKETVTEDLKRAKENADFVVVCPHWGTEYKLEPSDEQRSWAQLFYENGADLVIGTHPHVIEPMEWYGEAQAADGMLVYYSLGNFVNWTSGTGAGTANRMVGTMAEVTIGMDASGEAVITEYEAKPLVCHVEEGTDGVSVWFLEDYTEEQAEKNEIIRQDAAFSREYCMDLWEQVMQETVE